MKLRSAGMAWGRNRTDTTAKRALDIRLLVADGGLAQAWGRFPQIEACYSGGGLVGETDSRQKRDVPRASAGTLNICLAAPAESEAQPWRDLVGVQD
ncbi:MAG TPA: hypothetical protein VFJ52_13330 [Terriglobia bacterium]|nr:hypothetical protein [Terriglobia bacterium]